MGKWLKRIKRRLMALLISILVMTSSVDIHAFSKENTSDNMDKNGVLTEGIKTRDNIKVGDYIKFGKYKDEEIVWRCVLIDNYGPLMLSDKIISYKEYDAASSNYSNQYRRNNGSNYWPTSCIRQWLNSAESDINWINENPSYYSEAGFKTNFTNEEIKAVKTVTQKFYLNSLDSSLKDGGNGKLVVNSYYSFSGFVGVSDKASDAYYQNVSDEFFFLGPEQAEEIMNTLGEEYLIAEATEIAVNEMPSGECGYWMRLAANDGGSYENNVFIHPTGINAARCNDNRVGVRPAFYLNTETWNGSIVNETDVQENNGYYIYNGHYYKIFRGEYSKMTYNEAREFCKQQGGYLASITSAEEDSFIFNMLRKMGEDGAYFGLFRDDDFVWYWESGETVDYLNWGSGEPNNEGNIEKYGMYYRANKTTQWNDGCGDGGPFICEWNKRPGGEFVGFPIYQVSYIYENQLDTVSKYVYDNTPSSNMYDACKKAGAINSAQVWRDTQDMLKILDDASNMVDMPCKKQDVYEGIIFNILETSTEFNSIKSCEVKDAKSIISIVKTDMKSASLIDSDFKNLSEYSKEDQVKIRKFVMKAFDDEWKEEWKQKYVSYIFDAINYINDIEEYIEYVTNCYNIYYMSNSYKLVLKDMYSCCPEYNVDLKLALTDCISCIELEEKALKDKLMIHGFSVAGKNVIKTTISEMWKDIKSEVIATNPYMALWWVSYKTSSFLSNKLAGSDAIAEKTVKLEAMMDVRNLMQKVYEKRVTAYENNKTEENASSLLAFIDIHFNYLDEDCKTAESYVNAVSESIMGQITMFMGETSYEKRKHVIKLWQETYSSIYDGLMRAWLYKLEDEYPEMYQEYISANKNGIVALLKKYEIACPVDVYVYNLEGEVVASAVGSRAYCQDGAPFTVVVAGDKKELLFYDDEFINNYIIKYIGTDTGIMDVTIEEFDSEKKVIREVKQVDVPLQKNTTYVQEESYNVKNTYVLKKNDSVLSPDVDTQNSNAIKCKVNAVNGYISKDDDFEVQGEYYKGDKIKVGAYTVDGMKFLCWKIGDNIVSENREFTYIVENDCDIVAEYELTSPTSSEDVTKVFEDIPAEEWFVDAVQFVFDRKIMNGVSETTFAPKVVLTREQFITVLYNMEGAPEIALKAIFDDVKTEPNVWYAKPVTWAFENKITSGVGNGLFGTGNEITREQLATLLYNYAHQKDEFKLTIDGDAIAIFPDAGQISTWAADGMKWAVTNGVMGGKTGKDGKNILDPKGKATRAECAQMIKNLKEKAVK